MCSAAKRRKIAARGETWGGTEQPHQFHIAATLILQPSRRTNLLQIAGKSAATTASVMDGPFRAFYEMRVANGMLPAMARLTLARKMAAIALILWKKGETFAAEHLMPQAA